MALNLNPLASMLPGVADPAPYAGFGGFPEAQPNPPDFSQFSAQPMSSPMPQSPAMPASAPQGGQNPLQQLLMLLPLLVAAKQGGGSGVGGFAQGYLSSRHYLDEQRRVADAMRMRQEQEQYERDKEVRQESERRRQQAASLLMGSGRAVLDKVLDELKRNPTLDPKTVAAQQAKSYAAVLNRLYGLNIDPTDLEAVLPDVTSEYQQQRQAAARALYDSLRKSHTTKELRTPGRMYNLYGRGATWDEVAAEAGMPADLEPESLKPKPDLPNTSEERQLVDALAQAEAVKGSPLTPDERSQVRLQTRAKWAAAGRAPRVPRSNADAARQARAEARARAVDDLDAVVRSGVEPDPAQFASQFQKLGLSYRAELARVRGRIASEQERLLRAGRGTLSYPERYGQLPSPTELKQRGQAVLTPVPSHTPAPPAAGRGRGPAPARPSSMKGLTLQQRARVVLEGELRTRHEQGDTAAPYTVTDAMVNQFLANPKNRANLEQMK